MNGAVLAMLLAASAQELKEEQEDVNERLATERAALSALQSSKVEFDFMPMMLKRLTLTGSTLRPRSVAEKGAIASELHEKVWPLIESATVRPIIHKVFPLEQAAEGHRLMESSQHIGKIMLKVK